MDQIPFGAAPAERDPSLIANAHEYCDRCCWRCPLWARCEYYLDLAGSAGARVEPEAPRSDRWVISSAGHRHGQPPAAPLSLPVLPDLSGTTVITRTDPVSARALSDPLVTRATNYAVAASGIIRALRRLIAASVDHAVLAAVDRIDEACLLVGSKTFRAVAGSLLPEFDPDEVQSDANGSAKVARLLIEESRRAWMTLFEPGRALADGVAGRFVIVLNELEATLAERFPRALEFVRPGFDTEARETVTGAVNHAVCRSGAACGHA